MINQASNFFQLYMHIHCTVTTLNYIILNIFKNTYRVYKINVLIRAVGFLEHCFKS